ncbi:SCO4848 family membrane protein [Streptosporangium sandarakinum]|uniref:SCO4848 family membrane protein n=1 Tax=Streptosporangium sandarakinum TaxID=1260955 RepID=UPI00379C4FEE
MQMSRKIAGFLVGVAAFMIFEWINLGFNLADGHPTSFYVVHGVLVAVNILLALVIGTIGVRGLWGLRGLGSPRGPRGSSDPRGLHGPAEGVQRPKV